MFKANIIAVACLIMVTSITSCNILGGGDDDPPLEPGPRNYTWQVDTVDNVLAGYLNDIWGNSPEDVWAVSIGGLHDMWHFDGQKWEAQQNVYSLETVFGFSGQSVWAGGADGRIYYFDGLSWDLNFIYEKEGMAVASVRDIWGNSPSNLYAIGTCNLENEQMPRGFVLHYDGKEWKELATTEIGVQLLRVRSSGDDVLIRGVRRDQETLSETLILYSVNKGNLQEFISKKRNEVRVLWLNNVGKEIYSIMDNQLSLYSDRKMELFYEVPGLESIVGIDGRNEKDVFIHTRDKLLHYNGVDLAPLIEELPNNVYRGVIFENEVFFIIWDFDLGKTLIYHGTLTENEHGE